MATSSIFSNIEISDPKAAERFITALEESERAQAGKELAAPAIQILRDENEIRKLMSKRFPRK